MRLADFILRDMEAILAECVGFAATQLPAARHIDRKALRDHAREGARSDLDDAIRFNEAIDQALCESIAFFSAEVDQGRNLFLA